MFQLKFRTSLNPASVELIPNFDDDLETDITNELGSFDHPVKSSTNYFALTNVPKSKTVLFYKLFLSVHSKQSNFLVRLPLHFVKLTSSGCSSKTSSHSSRASNKTNRVHRGRRPARGQDRVPVGEGVGARDLQNSRRESVGHRRTERVGSRQETLGLRRIGSRENNRFLGHYYKLRSCR